MKNENNIDFGATQIHKDALEDICAVAVNQIDGVKLIENSFRDKFLEFFGQRSQTGIHIGIDGAGQVNIDLKISVRFGLNIQTVSQTVQNAIREAVAKAADVDLRDININVLRIEREVK